VLTSKLPAAIGVFLELLYSAFFIRKLMLISKFEKKVRKKVEIFFLDMGIIYKLLEGRVCA
jgi:hypothetical protein